MLEITDPQDFRLAMRSWLAENCPAEMRDGLNTPEAICWGGRNWHFHSTEQQVWLERCAALGLTVPTWPRDYGGAGLERTREKIFREELAAINARFPHCTR